MAAGGSVHGDPYYVSPSGETVQFSGLDNTWYMFASDSVTSVYFRVVPTSVPGNQYVDYASIVIPNHKIYVTTTGAILDGVPMVHGATGYYAGGNVVWGTGSAGENRVDITYNSWRIAVIIDPGTNLLLHPVTSPIHNITHLGLFLDNIPATNVTGLTTSSGANLNPSAYGAVVVV